MINDYIKSPINYMGCKYPLLPQILPFFPKEIDTFLDVFGGSGTVSFNVKAENIIYNDYIPYIQDIFKTWKSMKADDIVDYCRQYLNVNIEDFVKLRDEYNKTRDPNLLFILICYSYNGQFRFNSKHEYNSSFAMGIRTLNDNIIHNIIKCKPIIDKITYINKDFREIDYNGLTQNSLVYLDPPYSISVGVYQDGKRGFNGWSKQDDLDLFDLCDTLNAQNIPFAMSNLFSGKELQNDELIRWSKKYTVYHLNISYNQTNRTKSIQKDDEVLIVNYDRAKTNAHKLLQFKIKDGKIIN